MFQRMLVCCFQASVVRTLDYFKHDPIRVDKHCKSCLERRLIIQDFTLPSWNQNKMLRRSLIVTVLHPWSSCAFLFILWLFVLQSWRFCRRRALKKSPPSWLPYFLPAGIRLLPNCKIWGVKSGWKWLLNSKVICSHMEFLRLYVVHLYITRSSCEHSATSHVVLHILRRTRSIFADVEGRHPNFQLCWEWREATCSEKKNWKGLENVGNWSEREHPVKHLDLVQFELSLPSLTSWSPGRATRTWDDMPSFGAKSRVLWAFLGVQRSKRMGKVPLCQNVAWIGAINCCQKQDLQESSPGSTLLELRFAFQDDFPNQWIGARQHGTSPVMWRIRWSTLKAWAKLPVDQLHDLPVAENKL